MTYYHFQVLKIRENNLPEAYIIDRVIRAKHTIDTYFCDEIDLDSIASESFFSKFHFLRLFKSCYGKTPYQVITEKRILKAQQLLREGQSALATCHHLGFNSPTSFSIYFKKNTGLTPTDYKKAISDKVV